METGRRCTDPGEGFDIQLDVQLTPYFITENPWAPRTPGVKDAFKTITVIRGVNGLHALDRYVATLGYGSYSSLPGNLHEYVSIDQWGVRAICENKTIWAVPVIDAPEKTIEQQAREMVADILSHSDEVLGEVAGDREAAVFQEARQLFGHPHADAPLERIVYEGLWVTVTRNDPAVPGTRGQLTVVINSEGVEPYDQDDEGCPHLQVSVNDASVYDNDPAGGEA